MGFWLMVLDRINRRERVRHIMGAPSSPAGIAEKGLENIARKQVGDVPEVDPSCPHCEHKFDVMPGRKRKCPECKEWIWPMRPPGMKNKRLTTVEEALEWKLASAKNESSSAYALELAKQGKSFQDELRAANRDQLLEYKADGVKFVSISPAPDRCPSCRKMSKKRVNIADELRNQRLPCWDCVAEGVAPGWCRCVYIPH